MTSRANGVEPARGAAKPRIAVVMSGYGVVPRGAEAMLDELLGRLDDRFTFHVYSRSGKGPGGRRRPALGRGLFEPLYEATRIGRKILDTLFLDPLHIEWTSHLLLCLPSLVRGRYDVIWHETGLWGGYLMSLVRRLTGARLVDFAHSSDPKWETAFARRRPDLTITADPGLVDVLRPIAGLRVEVVPQGVDCDLFHPGAVPAELGVASPVGLIVGSLTHDKQPEIALEALSRAGASAVVVGSGPLAGALDALGARLFSEGGYRRISVERTEMPSIYAACDLVVLSSPLEAGSLTTLEAMACGRPVVTAEDAVRSEAVGEDGVLIAEQSVAAYAAGIAEALAADWGERPRRRAETRSVAVQATRFGDLLEELVR